MRAATSTGHVEPPDSFDAFAFAFAIAMQAGAGERSRGHVVRVTSGGIQAQYKIDRWD